MFRPVPLLPAVWARLLEHSMSPRQSQTGSASAAALAPALRKQCGAAAFFFVRALLPQARPLSAVPQAALPCAAKPYRLAGWESFRKDAPPFPSAQQHRDIPNRRKSKAADPAHGGLARRLAIVSFLHSFPDTASFSKTRIFIGTAHKAQTAKYTKAFPGKSTVPRYCAAF